MTDEKTDYVKKANLPLLYKELSPISHIHHSDYGVAEKRSFAFARDLTFVPLTMD